MVMQGGEQELVSRLLALAARRGVAGAPLEALDTGTIAALECSHPGVGGEVAGLSHESDTPRRGSSAASTGAAAAAARPSARHRGRDATTS